jgi:hypothetical protein
MKISFRSAAEVGIAAGAKGSSSELNAWCLLEPLASAANRSVLQMIKIE